MAVQNNLANKKKPMGISAYLTTDAVKAQVTKVVGGKDGPQFVSSVIAAVQQNPQLRECSNASIVSAALQGHALKLSPSPQLGHYYMVPFKDKRRGTTEAQFQLGYKGYVQLAIRSGFYKKLNVLAIKEGELIRYDPLQEEIEVQLIEDDIEREQTPTAGYYAFFEYENGFRKAIYWSKKKMLSHAEKYSFAFGNNGGAKALAKLEAGEIPDKELWKYSSFWFKDFDGMAMKTMLRQLISKWGIMSIDMPITKGYEADMTVTHEDGSVDYVEVEATVAPDSPESGAEEVVVEQAPPQPAKRAAKAQQAPQQPDNAQPAPVEDDDPFADYM